MSAEAGEVRTNRLVDLRGPGKAKVLKRDQRKYKIFGNQNLPRMKERRSQITSYHIPRGQDGLCLRGRLHRPCQGILITRSDGSASLLKKALT